MKPPKYKLLAAAFTAISACGALLAPPAALAQAPAEQETEILTRGPVHEAFAASVNFDPQPGILVSTQPPELIDELPPEQELEGDNVTWIAGYWAWDEDQSDFIWVSGVWRNIPPEREWIPGYWNETEGQYQWISGYWEDSETSEVAYLPPPPKTLENGPNIDRPSEEHSWIPGSWMWADTSYRWSPGYWEPFRSDWTYVPSYYRWTPRGHVYVGGYWDYPIARRGVVFAPVHFHGGYYREPGFVYSPVTVISIALLVDHLFVRPSYGHYYYGDYYEPRYRAGGYFGSVSFGSSYRGYDPIYAHERWHHRHERDWERNRMDDFAFYRDNRNARPPATWSALRELPDGTRGFKGRNADYMVAAPIDRFAARAEGGKRFKKLDQPERQNFVAKQKEMRTFRQDRKKQDTVAAPVVAKADGVQAKPEKVKVARSPIMGKKASQLGKEQAPPQRRKIAATDTTPDVTPERGKGTAKKDPDAMPGGNGKVKPEREPKVQPEKKAQPQREPKVQPEKKAQPQREPKVQPEKKAQPQREPKVQPEKKAQPQREPKVQPEKKAQPQREPKVQPEKKAQPQREPKVQPEKKAQPQREPKVQPEKKAQPQREPKVQPEKKAQPQREPKVQPEREKKEKEKGAN